MSTIKNDIKEVYKKLPRPEPSSCLKAYETEPRATLEMDRRKKENYEKYKSSSRREAEINYLPIKLNIENVS